MNILIAHAYAGIGHKKAALAVESSLLGFKDAKVKTVDVLDYTNPVFKFLYPNIYLFLINKIPFLWGLLYYFFEIKIVDRLVSPVRGLVHSITARKFIDLIDKTQPDVILCTHFLPAEVVSRLKKKKRYKGKLYTVVTDFISHSFWMARYSDCFIVCLEETRNDLLRRGIKKEKIKVLGIPCDPKFSITKDRTQLIEKIGIEKDLFNILIMGGGFGAGPVEDIIDSLDKIEGILKYKLQMLVICGKNKVLYEKLNKKKGATDVNLKVFGFMDNIDELMEVSDLLISKSGGLTISEALSKNLPMVIVNPIFGQETRNAKLLAKHGVAVKIEHPKDIVTYLKELLVSPKKMQHIRSRMEHFSYKDASKRIADFILENED
ncbi:MAG: glycosyltransferase [Candidatus Omnitrophota bacterium]